MIGKPVTTKDSYNHFMNLVTANIVRDICSEVF